MQMMQMMNLAGGMMFSLIFLSQFGLGFMCLQSS